MLSKKMSFGHVLLLWFSSLRVAGAEAAFGIRHQSKSIACRTLLHASTKRRGAMRRKAKTGFGKTETTTKPVIPEGVIYSQPALYDLAFGYRNFEEEVDFLLQAHRDQCSVPPSRILELAAGPARHSIEALRKEDSSVTHVTAVDSSAEMVEYATQVAEAELTDDKRQMLNIVLGDMRQIVESDTLFDSAWILLGSMQHLVTNQDVMDCFKATHNALVDGGTVIVELPHPRETFSMVELTRNGWEVPLQDESGQEYGEVNIIWGDESDTFNPISQVRNFTVSMELKGVPQHEKNGQLNSVKQQVPMRMFTAQEIDALAQCCGFEVKAMYGALSNDVDVNNQDESFRLVCVLRKHKQKYK